MPFSHEEVLSIGDSKYLIGSEAAGSISISTTNLSSPLGVTIIQADGLEVTLSWLQKTVGDMMALDDVWGKEFLSYILLQYSQKTPPTVGDDAWNAIKGDLVVCTGDIPSGPYVLQKSGVYQVFKLFPDPCGAFMYGVVESGVPGSYQRVFGDHIPIPSRHYFPPPSSSRPLSGKRIAVKDIYDIRGLTTGACSRAYEALNTEATTTAASIQQLIDMGAVIVGKTKTVQFASGMAPRDWVDYQCPFNQRGDGYLDPDCSSSGSAAGIAAYDWLDFSIGSDSLGSMVGPAAACGIFGLRPTHDALSNEGALAVSSYLDTPGHFSRDVSNLGNFAKLWLRIQVDTPFESPKRILFPPERFSPYAPSKLQVMKSFISDLEKSTQVQRTSFDINDLWRAHAPDPVASKPLDEFLATTLAHIQLYDSYHNNIRFRSEYKTKFGREPYVDPLIQYKWDLGAEISEKDYQQACDQKVIFKQFLEENVFADGTVLLLPSGDQDVSYRDEYSGSVEEAGKKWQGFGFNDTAFSALGGGPSVSFPVGQRLYNSKITGNEEFQPVSLMLLGAAGTDTYLIDLIKHVLKFSGRPLAVKTGKTTF